MVDDGYQIRTTQKAGIAVKTIAQQEGRTIKLQTEKLILAGAKALGYILDENENT